MNGFKAPSDLPQDLLLIHDIIGVITPSPKTQSPQVVEDCIDSSDDESANGSEAEIEADLVVQVDEEESGLQKSPGSPASSSDSDSDLEGVDKNIPLDADDEEEVGPVSASNVYHQTKHEVPEVDIIIPEVEEVNLDEELEKVGDITSIIDNVVVVQGLPGSVSGCGAERTLDSDTLLVFEDRKVLGHIYETFGPTARPLYQVRFNKLFPLDLEKVKISHEVFHIPSRSRFVFVDQIRRFKGSDASNVHDEEPAADELEFSDDEAEAAYRSLRRKRNGSRAGSISSSRQPTPTPSQLRDQDLVEENFMSRNAYDEHGPYDLDFSSGFSRPAPIPYDDPYSDAYSSEPPAPTPAQPERRPHDLGGTRSNRGARGARSRGPLQARGTRDNGRGRGRRTGGYENNNSFDRTDISQFARRSNSAGGAGSSASIAHGAVGNPSMSPTSLAITHATGQGLTASAFSHSAAHIRRPSSFSNAEPESWSYSLPPLQFGSHIQPHINPRFASAFGMNIGANVGMAPPQYQYAPYAQYEQYAQTMPIPSGASATDSSNWADAWIVRTDDQQPGKSLGNQAPADDETV